MEVAKGGKLNLETKSGAIEAVSVETHSFISPSNTGKAMSDGRSGISINLLRGWFCLLEKESFRYRVVDNKNIAHWK